MLDTRFPMFLTSRQKLSAGVCYNGVVSEVVPDEGSGEHSGWSIAPDGSFSAPLELAYPYDRTLGPTLGRFYTSLRDRRIEATVGSDGRVYAPPAEFDPVTGEPCAEWVEVGSTGVVTTWCWDPARATAWALVRLDGADVPMLHRVSAAGPESMTTGMRVQARWASETTGTIDDIECFEPPGDPEATP
jgi:uncharacterized OB-fold protein